MSEPETLRMTLSVDARALVHREWWHLPWRRRYLWLIPGARRRTEDAAVTRLTEAISQALGQHFSPGGSP